MVSIAMPFVLWPVMKPRGFSGRLIGTGFNARAYPLSPVLGGEN
jgi:hypothetical protein